MKAERNNSMTSRSNSKQKLKRRKQQRLPDKLKSEGQKSLGALWGAIRERERKACKPVVHEGLTYVLGPAGYYIEQDSKAVMLHRAIMKSAGHKVPRGWDIHHIDQCPTNNALLNLIAMPRQLHKQLHKWIDLGDPWGFKERAELELLVEMFQEGLPILSGVRPSELFKSRLQIKKFAEWKTTHAS